MCVYKHNMELYCVKCRARTGTNTPTTVTTKNNRLALSGICDRCGIKKIQIYKKKVEVISPPS